uniref:hypothetical protein n=1 Tax=Cellulomonas hominis TaxID=156981 RepID=UPI0018AC7D16|nr:hypothetical protein [Cellulomonas hominis]
MARSRTIARPVVVGAALALAAALSGCSVTNDITTARPYSASDGVGLTLGDLSAENLLLVAGAADAPGALQGGLTNIGEDTLRVTIELGDSREMLRVESGQTLLLGGPEGEEVVLDDPGAPGSTVEVTFRTDAAGEGTVPVPVLDGTLPEYADLVPEVVVETPEPSGTATASAEDTTEPGAEATAGTGSEDADQAGGTEG